MKLKEVFKKSIAMQLRDMGFRIMDAKVNFEHPKFVIYYFLCTIVQMFWLF